MDKNSLVQAILEKIPSGLQHGGATLRNPHAVFRSFMEQWRYIHTLLSSHQSLKHLYLKTADITVRVGENSILFDTTGDPFAADWDENGGSGATGRVYGFIRLAGEDSVFYLGTVDAMLTTPQVLSPIDPRLVYSSSWPTNEAPRYFWIEQGATAVNLKVIPYWQSGADYVVRVLYYGFPTLTYENGQFVDPLRTFAIARDLAAADLAETFGNDIDKQRAQQLRAEAKEKLIVLQNSLIDSDTYRATIGLDTSG